MAKSSVGTCELCYREEVERTEHHLIPREEGGTFLETAMLCIPCHKQIHALYTNQELAVRLYTVERLKDDPQLSSFIKWIKKQPPETLPKVKKSRERRKGKK